MRKFKLFLIIISFMVGSCSPKAVPYKVKKHSGKYRDAKKQKSELTLWGIVFIIGFYGGRAIANSN